MLRQAARSVSLAVGHYLPRAGAPPLAALAQCVLHGLNVNNSTASWGEFFRDGPQLRLQKPHKLHNQRSPRSLKTTRGALNYDRPPLPRNKNKKSNSESALRTEYGRP